MGAGVGKYHSILVGASGEAYASGGNKCGQLGVNNAGLEMVDKFRKCVVVDGGVGAKGEKEEENGEEDDEEGVAGVKIVQVSYIGWSHVTCCLSFFCCCFEICTSLNVCLES